MSGPLRDLVHAWRGLCHSPIFLAAALATIAIGIGANVTIFSIVNGISLLLCSLSWGQAAKISALPTADWFWRSLRKPSSARSVGGDP